MSVHTLEFDRLYEYKTNETGITVPVLLLFGERETNVFAKLDTGASHSIFARMHGENLGLDIESGDLLNVTTVNSGLRAFGHELKIQACGLSVFSKVYFFEDQYIRKSFLGRQGWLDRVKLGLIDYEGKLLLNAYGE